jgi:hypothetical protein
MFAMIIQLSGGWVGVRGRSLLCIKDQWNEHGNEPSGSINDGISQLGVWLASEKGLLSMELVERYVMIQNIPFLLLWQTLT